MSGEKKTVLGEIGTFADNAMLAGVVTNYTEDTPKNPKKKFDWARFMGQLVPLILAIKEVFDIFKN